MKRIRLIVVAALAAGAIGVVAAPASACVPDSPCCRDNAVNFLSRKYLGEDLIHCPW